jgi:hypothetical protein
MEKTDSLRLCARMMQKERNKLLELKSSDHLFKNSLIYRKNKKVKNLHDSRFFINIKINKTCAPTTTNFVIILPSGQNNAEDSSLLTKTKLRKHIW